MEVKFKAKIQKWGNSHVITIPAQYVKNKLLAMDQEYSFKVVEEIEEEK